MQTIRPEDIIQPDKIEDYKKDIEIIHRQLVYIKNNSIILSRIHHFPHHLFPTQGPFWSLIAKALFDSIVIMFDTILNDNNQITLRQLRTKIRNPMEYRLNDVDVNQDALKELNDRISNVQFDGRIKLLQEKINTVRNTHIAHLDYDIKSGKRSPTKLEVYNIPIENVDKAIEISNDLLQVLGLNVNYALEFFDYLPPTHDIDIDEIFADIVYRSFWFDKEIPEKYWFEEYKKLSSSDQLIIDDWKKKLSNNDFNYE